VCSGIPRQCSRPRIRCDRSLRPLWTRPASQHP
jgi:hypothetical protein